jgi:hypothetical protein
MGMIARPDSLIVRPEKRWIATMAAQSTVVVVVVARPVA